MIIPILQLEKLRLSGPLVDYSGLALDHEEREKGVWGPNSKSVWHQNPCL